MRYARSIEVPRPPEEVFAYLAAFENAAEWDPGIESATRLTPVPTAVGSRFEVVATFRGNAQRFEYVVTAFEPGRRIALDGDGEKARSRDVITVEPTASGSRVGYEADITLKGVLRVAEPFLGRTVRRMGDDALDGLRRALS